eukprot:gene20712-23526_t
MLQLNTTTRHKKYNGKSEHYTTSVTRLLQGNINLFDEPRPTDLYLSILLSIQGLAFEGDSPANYLGYAVQGIGDINGDGKDDFALGAPHWDSRGTVYIVFGRTRPAGGSHDLFYFTNEVPQIGFPLYGVQGGDQWGRGISPVGDVNGDGLEDFMLCSDMASDEYFYLVGMCFVFLGRDDFHTVTSIDLNEFLSHTYGDPRVFKIIGIDGWNAMV